MAVITVTGTYIDVEEVPLSGKVVFTPYTSGPSSAGNVIAQPVVAAVVEGVLSITLLTTDSYNYVNGLVSYRVYEKIGTIRRVYYVVLPSTLGSTVDIATLERFTVPPDVIIDPDAGTSTDPEVAQLQARLDAAEATIETLTATVSALSGSVNGYDSRITAIEDDLGSGIAGIEATLAARLNTITATQSADKVDLEAVDSALDDRIADLEDRVGNARLFSGTSYPPGGYTARDGDVWVDTTP